jgi:ribosomal protein L27
MKDETVEALEDCISNLTAIANSGQSIYPHYTNECRQKAKTLTTLRDSLATRPIVGIVEGKAVRAGDVVVWNDGTSRYYRNTLVMVGSNTSLATIGPDLLSRCRLPTAVDFGGKQ